jgi:hypothetical protein
MDYLLFTIDASGGPLFVKSGAKTFHIEKTIKICHSYQGGNYAGTVKKNLFYHFFD